MQYLLTMNPWHKAGRVARRISDPEERFDFFLDGRTSDSATSFLWPRFAQRVDPYVAWLSEPGVFSCSYEALTSDQARGPPIDRLVDHLRSSSRHLRPLLETAMKRGLEAATDPSKSHTFRAGKQREWSDKLSPSQIDRLTAEVKELVPQFVSADAAQRTFA
jgi:hypothetical protein